jgi:hypothetical protein
MAFIIGSDGVFTQFEQTGSFYHGVMAIIGVPIWFAALAIALYAMWRTWK